MEAFYLGIVAFLIALAVFDLFVGVSNDAVNFMQSAIGARVASFRTVLVVASVGVMLGAVLSHGMMDVARHGIINPQMFSLTEVLALFMAVMVCDVLVLNMFNSLGLPTSTTVSLVFELLGGAVALSLIKVLAHPTLSMGQLINTDKALQVIIAIFVSVAVAFVAGMLVQWVARVVFTFHYRQHQRWSIALFGGLSIALLSYFVLIKGIGKSPVMPSDARLWIQGHTALLLATVFVTATAVSQLLHWAGVNIFKLVVMLGTFALALAFAGNDLVNFIGVPLAGLDAVADYHAHGQGMAADSYKMTVLNSSAATSTLYLALAGGVMIVALVRSKKARRVIQTGIGLSRQDEGDEMFGSSKLARILVRTCINTGEQLVAKCSRCPLLLTFGRWIDSRFRKADVEQDVAFDVVRAAVNIVLAAALITLGTTLKLPLSTTYVTFIVAMGSSLADRAWGRESAVFRVTGVLSVIGGWFFTAGIAFAACALITCAMYFGGVPIQVAAVAVVVYVLTRGHKSKAEDSHEAQSDAQYRLMMHTADKHQVWQLLKAHFIATQTLALRFAAEQYGHIVEGFCTHRVNRLNGTDRRLKAKQQTLRKLRKQELLALRRCPHLVAAESNTWFHVGINASRQYLYCLGRMWEPAMEHVDNNFKPLPRGLVNEYEAVKQQVFALLAATETCISTAQFSHYRDILAQADRLKDHLSAMRKSLINTMQESEDTALLQVHLVYLNLLQETQQFLSNMRHQLRGTKKFLFC